MSKSKKLLIMNLLRPLVPGPTTNSVSSGPQQHYNNSIMLCVSNFCYGGMSPASFTNTTSSNLQLHNGALGTPQGDKEKQSRRKRRCKLCDKNGGDDTQFICNGRIKGRNRCQFYNTTSCKEHTDGTNINNTLQEELSRHSAYVKTPALDDAKRKEMVCGGPREEDIYNKRPRIEEAICQEAVPP